MKSKKTLVPTRYATWVEEGLTCSDWDLKNLYNNLFCPIPELPDATDVLVRLEPVAGTLAEVSKTSEAVTEDGRTTAGKLLTLESSVDFVSQPSLEVTKKS